MYKIFEMGLLKQTLEVVEFAILVNIKIEGFLL